MKITLTPVAAAICMLAFGAHALGASPLMGAPASVDAQAATALVSKLTAHRTLQGLDADHNYVVTNQHPGVEGTVVARASHTYKGVRVFGSESVVVVNGAGQILSESVSERRLFLGRGPANKLGAVTASFSVKPAITPQAAIAVAVKSTAPKGKPQVAPTAELVVYPIVKTERVPAAASKPEAELNAFDVEEVVAGYELSYHVRTRMLVGNQPYYYDTVVSARDGRIINQWSMLQTKAAGVGNSQYNGVVPLSTTQQGDTFKLVDPLRGKGGLHGGLAVTNANHGTSAGELYAHWSNTWGDGKQFVEGGSTTGANGQTAAVNAMWGLMNTYDMMKNTLGWQSLDGQNSSTYIAVHVNTAYDNAYYSDTCKCMFIGDGSSFSNLGAIDVVGHEMGHGVTAATSNLLYFAESGGLNESASDISGEMVEAYARAGGTGAEIPNKGNDWQMGTEISKSGTPLRWMYKPSKDGSSPDAWSSTLKRIDVHYSSGPNNRMFYFLSQGSNADKGSEHYSKYLTKEPQAMTGIGADKAYRIWFKALTTKFTAVTNYADARNKVLASAQELYGMDSKEAVAVQRAYAAINVGPDVSEQR
ncbi:MAG TPA: M4 family metallopeptidase [Telluria sp.]